MFSSSAANMTYMTLSAPVYPPRAEIHTRTAPYAGESKRVSHQHPDFMTLERLSDIEPRGNTIRCINECFRVCVYETLLQTRWMQEPDVNVQPYYVLSGYHQVLWDADVIKTWGLHLYIYLFEWLKGWTFRKWLIKGYFFDQTVSWWLLKQQKHKPRWLWKVLFCSAEFEWSVFLSPVIKSLFL